MSFGFRSILYRLARIGGDYKSVAKGKPDRRVVSRKVHKSAGNQAKRLMKGMFR